LKNTASGGEMREEIGKRREEMRDEKRRYEMRGDEMR
jgi:hypothetical protein